ncbi:ATP-binding protein [Paenibacillus ihumii]|uniref:ATP-binding protein n=1 Tax=Paenibacillus ihumii TaxID=687436 RepID=UPI0006D7C66F|nr:ATP-binding protein [Paenibacillus ihumii]
MKVVESVYEFRFIIELFVLCLLFTTSFQRRKYFAFRVLLIVLLCVGLAGLFLFVQDDIWMFNVLFTIARYVLLFFAVMAGVMFCYKVSILTSIFCVTGVYAVQHLIYNLNEITFEGFGLKQRIVESSTSFNFYALLYFVIASLLYALLYWVFIKKFQRQDEKYFQNKIIIVLCIFVNLYATVFSIVFRITQENAQFEIFLICVLLDIMCCLFTMYVLFYIFNTSALKDELNIIQSLLKKEKDQFAISQANIQLINIKCHDLKHQLTHLSNRLDESEVEELKKVISIYDIPMTGNPVLDVVIAEKKLQCEREEIEFTCMVDGEKLGFMREADIYSMFGNALDNAINSVRKISERDKRVVSLIIKDTIGLISIHIENYFQGELVFEDGLPVTTNQDKDYHGFGMKSMKYLVEKYGGELSIKLDEDIFNLNIVFHSR